MLNAGDGPADESGFAALASLGKTDNCRIGAAGEEAAAGPWTCGS
jgi:hypothetical protein